MPDTGQLVSPLLVGRDDLLQLSSRRLAEVKDGHGHMLLLAGEPGIGKTRLLRAVVGHAVGLGFRWSKGDVGPHDQLVVLAGIADLARSLQDPTFGDLGARLAAVDRDRGDAHRGGDALGTRRGIVRDVVDLILQAIDRPTLLAFEDLQWADDMTLEVIAELARGSRELPLFILGVYRLNELPTGSIHREWRSRLLTQRLAEEARLQRLNRDQTGLVTTLLLGTGLPAPREVVDAVYKRTNGIPLHIEELLAAVGHRASDGQAILGAHVPDTIEDAILAHAGRLSEQARAVARAGAVLGRCFAPDVVAGILDLPPTELDESLEELVKGGILYPFEHVDEGYFDFRHQLLRDAIYNSVPARDLRRFHARAAEFGATLYGASEIHASAHFERAGMREQAFRAALGAAEAATRVSSHREAFDLFRRALQNMPDSVSDSERARIQLAFSDSAGALDLNDISNDAAVRARELALRAGDGAAAAEALVNLYVMATREDRPAAERRDLARRLSLEVDALPEGSSKALFHCLALQFLAAGETDLLRLEEARSYLREALDVAGAAGLEAEVREIDMALAKLDIREGRVSQGLDAITVLSHEALAAGQESTAVGGYRDLAIWAARSLDYRRAATHIAEGLRYAEQIEQSFCGHVLASIQAQVAWADGRWSEAARQGAQALSDPGSIRSKSMAGVAIGYVAAGRGDRATAEAHLGMALEHAERSDVLEWILPVRWGLAEAALMAGDPDGAIRHCEDALEQARQRGEWGLLAPFVVTGVRAYQLAGRPDAASKWLGQVVRAIGPVAEVASPAIKHGTGLVKLGEGSINAARESLEAAIAEWDRRGRRWEALWARLDLAAAHLRANRYAEAMQLLEAVSAAAHEMESAPLLARAEQLTRLAKGRGAEREAWHPLTVREWEVARKIAEGLTNAAIAEELFVSPRTVSAHVEHILAKLGASRRAEVAAWVSTVAPAAAVA